MLENILIYNETGQTANPKSQITIKFQVLNLKFQTKKKQHLVIVLNFPDRTCLVSVRPG